MRLFLSIPFHTVEFKGRFVQVFLCFALNMPITGCSELSIEPQKTLLTNSTSVIQPSPSLQPVSSAPSPLFSPSPSSSGVPLLKPPLLIIPEPSPLPPIPTPQPLKANSICPLQHGTLEGKVRLQYVEESKALPLLSHITVKAQSLDPLVPYATTTEVKEGLYRLENFPLNTSVEMRVFKETYLVHRKIVKFGEPTGIGPQSLQQDFSLYFEIRPLNPPPPVVDNSDMPPERLSVNGKVVDEQGQAIEGVKMSIIPLAISIVEDGTGIKPFYGITGVTDKNGLYSIGYLPEFLSFVQMQMIASKPELASASRFVDKIKSNRQGDPNANRYDFGVDLRGEPDKLTALADAPLVVDVGLTRTDEVHINPTTTFTLKFSEPMDYISVEKNFILKVFEVAQKPDEQQLSCVPQTLSSNQPIVTFRENDFMAIWNSDMTEVDFRLKTLIQLPSPDKVWIGQITFIERINDIKGTARTKEFFRLNTEYMQNGYWFIFKGVPKLP